MFRVLPFPPHRSVPFLLYSKYRLPAAAAFLFHIGTSKINYPGAEDPLLRV